MRKDLRMYKKDVIEEIKRELEFRRFIGDLTAVVAIPREQHAEWIEICFGVDFSQYSPLVYENPITGQPYVEFYL